LLVDNQAGGSGRMLMRNRPRRPLVVLACALLASAVLGAHAASPVQAGVFGFNYWPHCMSNNVLGDSDGIREGTASDGTPRFLDDWKEKRPTVEQDLDQIASLGGGVVRFMIWPNGNRCNLGIQHPPDWSAWKVNADATTPRGAGRFTDEFEAQTSNVADLIRLASERKLKVIVAFGNTHFKPIIFGPDPNSTRDDRMLWEVAYGRKTRDPDDQDGWYWFLRDSLHWINGYVDAIEGNPSRGIPPSAGRDAVIAYDYNNESSSRVRTTWDYVNQMYDRSHIPWGKRLVSPQRVDPAAHSPTTAPPGGNDAHWLARNLGERRLNFVDFHSYREGSNLDAGETYDFLKNGLPPSYAFPFGQFHGATALMGEFGEPAPFNNLAEERSQSNVVRAYISQAQARGMAYYVHWMLWDHTPPGVKREGEPRIYGLGSDPHRPKDALGDVSETMQPIQLVPNPDMEQADGSQPAGWTASGSPAVPSLRRVGPNAINAATNLYSARLWVAEPTSPEPAGWVRLSSGFLDVSSTAGQRNRQLFVNAYIRSNMADVQVNTTEYDDRGRIKDASGQIKPQTRGGAFQPFVDGSSWSNYLHRVGAWRAGDPPRPGIPLEPGTTRVVVSVEGKPRVDRVLGRGGSYLDVDAVSAAVR
jgi:hypothetical protein